MVQKQSTETSVLSDSALLSLCHQYGLNARLWRQKFLGLLPEVEKRKLYEQKGCTSIFEFAAKLAGVSREQVLLALRLDKRFDSTPQLKRVLSSGTVSLSKLARVASVATPNNQGFWITQAHLLSKQALEVLVKDAKDVPGHASNVNKIKSLEKVPQSDELNFSRAFKQRLLTLQNKGIKVEEVLAELLDQREVKIQQDMQEIGEEMRKIRPAPSRYIPVKVKNILNQQYGSKCAHQKCSNKAINTHHQQRFAMNGTHDPIYLVPLCKFHHEITHTIDQKVVQHRIEQR